MRHLTTAERDLIVTLCEFALEDEHIPPSMRREVHAELEQEDFARLRGIVDLLYTTDDPPSNQYTPPGGRL